MALEAKRQQPQPAARKIALRQKHAMEQRINIDCQQHPSEFTQVHAPFSERG